jgi:hypothetical protein
MLVAAEHGAADAVNALLERHSVGDHRTSGVGENPLSKARGRAQR